MKWQLRSGGDFGEEFVQGDASGGEGDEGVGAVGGGVFGEAEGGFDIVGLDADDEFGGLAFTGGKDGFGALEAFGFGEGPELAGELGPGEALDAAAVEKGGFFGEGGSVELAVGEERRLDDGEDAAEGAGGRGGGEERGEENCASGDCHQCDPIAADGVGRGGRRNGVRNWR